MQTTRLYGRTREDRWNTVLRCARLIGVIDNYGASARRKVKRMLDENPHVILRKEGTAQSAPAWYCAVLNDDEIKYNYSPKVYPRDRKYNRKRAA
jgi:hypothetical protein